MAITAHGGDPGVAGQDLSVIASHGRIRPITPVLHTRCRVFHSMVYCYRRSQCFAFQGSSVWSGCIRTLGIALGEVNICRSWPKSSDPAALEGGRGVRLLTDSPERIERRARYPVLNTAVWESRRVSEAWRAMGKGILILCLLSQFVSLQ